LAKELLSNPQNKRKLVLDWRRRQQNKATVKVAIRYTLDKLPESFTLGSIRSPSRNLPARLRRSYAGRDAAFTPQRLGKPELPVTHSFCQNSSRNFYELAIGFCCN
jgi:hypothetical protein